MVKNKYTLLLSFMLLLITSCTMKENIERDLILETTPIDFNIPIVSSITDTVSLAEISTQADLNALITEHTNGFTVNDLKSIQITSFRILMINQHPGADTIPVDSVNNLRAFRSISVKLKKPDKSLLTIGLMNNSNAQTDTLVQVPITNNQELKDQLNNNAFNYVITGVALRPTTEIIKAQAIVQYKFKLGM